MPMTTATSAAVFIPESIDFSNQSFTSLNSQFQTFVPTDWGVVIGRIAKGAITGSERFRLNETDYRAIMAVLQAAYARESGISEG